MSSRASRLPLIRTRLSGHSVGGPRLIGWSDGGVVGAHLRCCTRPVLRQKAQVFSRRLWPRRARLLRSASSVRRLSRVRPRWCDRGSAHLRAGLSQRAPQGSVASRVACAIACASTTVAECWHPFCSRSRCVSSRCSPKKGDDRERGIALRRGRLQVLYHQARLRRRSAFASAISNGLTNRRLFRKTT
jgi:hypothetical protein